MKSNDHIDTIPIKELIKMQENLKSMMTPEETRRHEVRGLIALMSYLEQREMDLHGIDFRENKVWETIRKKLGLEMMEFE